MFDVLIMYGGNTKKSDEDYVILDKLLDRTRVTMNRVPQRGEGVNLFIENFHVFFEVRQVYTTLDVTSDEHYERYRILADEAEIVEEFKNKEERNDTNNNFNYRSDSDICRI